MKKVILIVVMSAIACLGQEQNSIQDLNLLVGKQVIVQRIPLCQPGTYTTVLTYSGKQATVVSLKPYKSPYPISQAVLDKMPPAARAMIEDQLKAATLLLQFEDGTKLDTCAPIGPSKFSDSFELAPGQTLPAPPSVATTPTPAPTPNVAATALPVATANQPQAGMLSDEEVKLALEGKGKDHWVLIQDMGLMAAQGNQVPTISLFMPEAVLGIQAQSAKKQFTHYEPTEEDRRKSLMIVTHGYAGKTIAGGCTSITRIVLLSDSSGGIVKEAYLTEPLGETWRNGFGATNECQALRAKFSLNDVQTVRQAAPNGEFIVAVFAGSVNTKMYKIKRKHQSKLTLE
ncbi:MAG: hypothetical protein WCD47_19150 [Candidatus Sulfotelmatobacter sp.]